MTSPAALAAVAAALALLCGCGPPSAVTVKPPDGAARELERLRPGPACRALARAPGPAAEQPGGIERLRLRARCRAALGQGAAAVAEARAAVRARPDDAQAHAELALALLAYDPTHFVQALAPLCRAAQLRPDRPEYPYLAGVILLDDERVREALPRLEKAVALDGRRAAPRLALAQALIDAGEASRARTVLAAVPDLEPTVAEVERGARLGARLAGIFHGVSPAARAAYRRAAALLDQDLPGQAVSALEDLIRASPGFAAAHTLLGLAHVKLGNDARAFAALQRAEELNPDDPTNHLYLGLIYLDRDRVEQATPHLERAVELDPFSARGTAALARLREQAHDFAAAARLYRRLVALDGGSGPSLRALARALTAAGDRDGAQRALERAVDREPSSYESHLMLGEAYQARWVESRPDQGRAWAERARRHLQRALELHPGDEAARRALERLKP